jgi:hypothetical protein
MAVFRSIRYKSRHAAQLQSQGVRQVWQLQLLGDAGLSQMLSVRTLQKTKKATSPRRRQTAVAIDRPAACSNIHNMTCVCLALCASDQR